MQFDEFYMIDLKTKPKKKVNQDMAIEIIALVSPKNIKKINCLGE